MEIFTCPKGHIVNADTMKAVVSLMDHDIDKAMIFICEAGPDIHDFSLKTAIRTKMFSPEQIERLRNQGEQHRRENGYQPVDSK